MSQKFKAPLSTLDQMTNGGMQADDCVAFEQTRSFNGMGLQIGELDKRYTSQPTGADGPMRLAAGAYTVTSGDVSGTQSSINTGLAGSVNGFVAQILRSGATITGDAKVSASGMNLVVQSGTSVYVLTAGDVINWIATGI